MNHPYSEETHRFLDGDDVRPADADREDAERLRTAVTAYARGLEQPRADLDDRVMEHVAKIAARPSWRTVGAWLVTPVSVPVRPALGLAAAGVAILAGVALLRPDDRPEALTRVLTRTPQSTVAAAVEMGEAAQPNVLVRFQLHAPLATEVVLLGSFNEWSRPGIPMTSNQTTGMWTATLAVPVGVHEYGYLVNDGAWTTDPAAHGEVDDDLGRTNSMLVVGPRGVATR